MARAATRVAGAMVAVAAIGAPSAHATAGVLEQFGVPQAACLSGSGSIALCAKGLVADVPVDMAVTADGKSAYVVSPGKDDIAVLTRTTTTGRLLQSSCISETGGDGCADGQGLLNPTAVVVSPTGKSVYVSWAGASSQGGLTAFNRNTTTGALTFAGCFAAGGFDGCAPMDRLTSATDVAISPDAKSVFVSVGAPLFGVAQNALLAFKRNTTTGALTYGACYRQGGGSGCTAANGLSSAQSIAVTADNKSVYVASASSAVAIFKRNTTTLALTQGAGPAACVATAGAGGCADAGPGLSGAVGVAATADNKSVYVAALGDDALTTFKRTTTTGALTPAGCISRTGTGGCTAGVGLDGAFGVAASKDNKSVYVAANADDAVVDFVRNTTTGALTEKDCVARAVVGCATGIAMDGARTVTVTADNKYAYVVSDQDDAVAEFARTTTVSDIGKLTQLETPPPGCFSGVLYGTTPPCTLVDLPRPAKAQVTKDGKSVYASDGTRLMGFTRNTTTGRLTRSSCLTGVAAASCADEPGLATTTSVVASADSRSVYVASRYNGGTLVSLRRNTTTGALTHQGCLSVTPVGDCTPGEGLGGANSVAISKDGKSVYVVSSAGGLGSVVTYARNTTTGALTPKACFKATASGSCTALPELAQPYEVAVSPDGKALMLVQFPSTGQPPALRFTRNTTTGLLTRAGCISETGAGGCTVGRGILEPTGVTFSPDSRSVYVAGSGGAPGYPSAGSVALFARNTTTGALTQPAGAAGCIASDPTALYAAQVAGCATGRALPLARTVVVSPDGKSVYAGGGSGMAVLNRSTASATLGQLSQSPGAAGCIVFAAGQGCSTAVGLTGTVSGIAISADNKSLYAANPGSEDNIFATGSLLAFKRLTS